MSETKYFYADPQGNVRENDKMCPLDLLRSKHFGDGLMFRFAVNPDEKKFYLQDPSFRKLVSDGDKNAWYFVNQALDFTRSSLDLGLLDRINGEPEGGCIKKKVSDYQDAWDFISKTLDDELGVSPRDMQVLEFTPSSSGPCPCTFLRSPGEFMGNEMDESFIALDRHGDDGPGYDVSHRHMNDLLKGFYLDRVEEIHDDDDFKDGWERHLDDYEGTPMVAFSQDGETKIFKKSPRISMDSAYEKASSMADEGVAIPFSFLPSQKRIQFHRHTPLELSEHSPTSKMLKDLKGIVSKSAGIPEEDVVLSFCHGLSNPYMSKLSRYRIPWLLLEEDERPDDIDIIEVPMDLDGATMIGDQKKEQCNHKSLLEYRILNGLDVKHPFMAVDNRIGNDGMKFRRMAEEYGKWKKPDKYKTDTFGFKGMTQDEQDKMEDRIRFVLNMGLPCNQVLDLFSSRRKLSKRAECRRLLERILDDRGRSRRRRKRRFASSKQAAIGPSYDVNSWQHIGLQEEINRAQHDQGKPKKKFMEPYNLGNVRKLKSKHHESLLDAQRDKDLGYMKSTEQLLRENQI